MPQVYFPQQDNSNGRFASPAPRQLGHQKIGPAYPPVQQSVAAVQQPGLGQLAAVLHLMPGCPQGLHGHLEGCVLYEKVVGVEGR